MVGWTNRRKGYTVKQNLTVPIGKGPGARKVIELRGVKARPAGVAGLVIHRAAVENPDKRTPWVVTHEGSQMRLPGYFGTLASARAAVEMVKDLDWTADAKTITDPRSRGYVEDSYGTRWIAAMREFYNGDR
jgi:hypothetical protein